MDPEERLDMARTTKQSTEYAVRETRRRTRRNFAPEEKVRIVLEGLPCPDNARFAIPRRAGYRREITQLWNLGTRGTGIFLERLLEVF